MGIPIPEEYKELYNPDWRNIVLHGGRYSGKSYNVAESQVLRGRQFKKRFLCTREFQNTIRDSVHKLLCDIIDKHKFKDYIITNDSIRNRVTGSEWIFRGLHNNVTEIKSLEGIDEVWVEEAQSISDNSLDILTPTIRKPGSRLIFTFNRVNELDPVFVRYVLNKPPNTYVSKLNYDVMDKYGYLSDVIKQEIENDKRTDPGLYAHKWLGEPMSQQERSIISRDDTLRAMQRPATDDGAEEVGVDVARMGNDRTALWKRKGLATMKRRVFQKLRIPQICDEIERFVGNDKKILIKVDDTGVGGGVTDEMMKRGYNIMAVNFGEKATEPDKYPNLISEAWFHMANVMPEASLPMDSDLLMELTTRQWKQDSRGRRMVESKADYKKRGFRSPDLADACIICYYSPERPKVEMGFF
jgi:phage terminase large subunit